MAIYLVRHGETDGNRNRILQTPDTPLSTLGQQQAQEFAIAYKDTPIEAILCSDYLRTKQTIEPLLKLQSHKVTYEPLLQERSFGDIRGKAYDDVEDDFFAEDYAPPNGETKQQFVERVAKAWECIVKFSAEHSGDILVMTHGLVLREIVNTHLEKDPAFKYLSDYHNTCVTKIEMGKVLTVLSLCDISHLSTQTTASGAV
ncbi:histidine phosphatase family protein [Paraglaciecola marina]|uniref:histidine phosphatase family protein n=1 Tax=Paraglaciecola marina TaxID=2500157 RepID=UPI00105C63A1|nr:histidine phosphatase family protein [Paraglaciecola marina]